MGNGLSCGGKDFLESKAADEHAHSKSYSQGSCAGQHPKSSVYPQHGSATPRCPRGTMFEAGFSQFTQGFLVGSGNKFSVMDELQVPNKPGKYVLGWRWDCEETDQVWNSCADIEIVDGPTPAPAPTPAPTPAPPAPEGKYVCYLGACYNKGSLGTMSKADCDAECGKSPGPAPGPAGKGDYLCYAGKCYEKPGYGKLDQQTCRKSLFYHEILHVIDAELFHDFVHSLRT